MQKIAIDEYPIREIPRTPLWSENYALMFADPAARTSVYFSCGRWLDEPSIWREVIGVTLPDGRTLVAKNYGRNSSPKGPGASLASLEVVEPERKLRLRFAGPAVETTQELLAQHGFRDGPKKLCELDLSFDAVSPVWNMKGDSVEASTIAGALHIEQIGTANGNVRVDGQDFPLAEGYSVRDHSRGPRDVSRYRWHCWLNGRFPDDTFFYVYGMQLQGDERIGMSNAAVFRDGKLYPAQLVSTDLTVEPEDYRKLHSLVLTSELGEMRICVKRVITSFLNSMIRPYDMSPGWTRFQSAAHMMDQLVEFEWDGKSGLGWSERGIARTPL